MAEEERWGASLQEIGMTGRSREGRCRCGAVNYRLSGEPKRVGLCHCTDCRQESGSAFTAFGIWPRERFSMEGEIRTFAGRSFCPSCGSRLFSLSEDEAEIKLGTLDEAPNEVRPTYELWIKRREPWLPPLSGAEQFEQDRP
jgi:hypothetical protein